MALTLRLEKGYELTYAELDDNFTYLSSSFLSTSSFNSISSSLYTGSYTGSLTGELIQAVNTVIPTGTASFVSGTNIVDNTNTTTYLNYGINVITTVTSQSYCVRLPQVPKMGKSVYIINKSGVDLWVFPSTGSGDINGNIDGYSVIPSDGQSYTFNCYENPLPGGWSSVSVYPGGYQVQLTGIVSSSIGAWGNSTSGSSVLAYVNNSTKASGSGNYSISWTGNYDPYLNNQWGTFTDVPNNGVGAYYFPSQTWKRINSLQIFTNITGSLRGSLQPGITQQSTQYLLYQAGTTTYASNYDWWTDPAWTAFRSTTYNSWITTNISTDTFWGNMSTSWIGGHTPSVVPGTFIPTTPGSIYSTAVGGPGTAKYTLFFNPNVDANQVGKMIGKTLIGTYFSSVLGYGIDVWTKRSFGFLIKNYSSNITQIQLQARLSLTLA
jgi:hypothetical protein